ncbi:MAG: GNAT family N-acetyltransferase, partial [Candidatus Sumerlaeia bacterium]|nr:GNAT family N-acetyltransferase [Candidatus Sumerlaeia bacterium]
FETGMKNTAIKIRQIRSEEKKQIVAIYNNAYRVPIEVARQWMEEVDIRNTRAIFEGKRLVSMLQIIPYEVWLGGKVVPMGGIGGVATWADRQGKGYAGALMLDSLTQLRERKLWVSVLYPFSFRYYRKFGWEIAGYRLWYTNFKQNDLFYAEESRLVDAGKDTENIDILDTIYEEMARKYNVCIKRNKFLWRKKLNWLKKNNGQVYIIREGTKYIGWFFCQNKPLEGKGSYESITNEFAFTTEKALRAMMGFLSTLPTNVTKITLASPYNLDLWVYFKEAYVQTEKKATFQFRIVDLIQAVKTRGYSPEISAKISINIHDDCASWNTGTWDIELQSGKVVTVKRSSAPPDAECDIQTFSQLFCGYATAEDLLFQSRLKVKNNQTPALLNAIFHDYPTHLQDWF